MKLTIRILWLLLLLSEFTAGAAVRHYVFFNRDRERIKEPSFLETKAFEGAQLKFTWRDLEPERDRYDFKSIREDLAFLTGKNKKLFIQLQDSTFDTNIVLVPRYLQKDPRYNGGADLQYAIPGDDESKAVPEGWVARRWDPAVRERFHKLMSALGKEFDGKIEGINLAETSVTFGESGKLFPKGFTPLTYREAVIANMAALKLAFPKSVAMQYANFMPGEWLPEIDHGHIKTVFERARELKVAMGGPDLLPNKPGQMKHSYPLIQRCSGIVPTGVAVQDGNYVHRDPKTGKQVSVADLIAFGRDHLKVTYIFWCTEEPFYSQKVIPELRK